ncbi:MAG: DUF1592 domain-containing protein [Planctomycetaceae bacterium]
MPSSLFRQAELQCPAADAHPICLDGRPIIAAIHGVFMRITVAVLVASLSASVNCVCGADPFPALAEQYAADARPVLERYCVDCHAAAEPAGELDLEGFATLDDVRRKAAAWVKVAEMLDDGQMPPEDAEQPTPAERARLRTWVERYLDAEARASAGDPGPVPLRRLSNAEYGYTIRDLTGVELDPAREFPADGAAGEGFTNASSALVMSPALLSKYFDAGKEIARHAVLLPDGFRFTAATTRRDRTEVLLTDIRELYGRYAAADGSTEVNLQGIKFATNAGGRLPVERYLLALLEERDAFASGDATIETVAAARRLSPRYLASLRDLLTDGSPSPLLDPIRTRWRKAGPEDAASIAAEITTWQKSLATFQNVGHMRPWVVPVDPLTSRQEIRQKIEPTAHDEAVLRLFAGDAGNGNHGDYVVWQQPRFVAPGRPDLLLRDVRALTRELTVRREQIFGATTAALEVAAAAQASGDGISVGELATRHDVDEETLEVWFNCLGIGTDAAADLTYLTDRIERSGDYDFVQGWSQGDLPNVVANSSDRHVRIPGNMRPHGVAVHPTPTHAVAVGWQSPVAGSIEIDGVVTHAHPECGNGVSWTLELRRGGSRRRLASGTSAGANAVTVGPVESLKVRTGDLVALLIGPRDGNHSCDLTDVELTIKTGETSWNLSAEVSNSILAGNPHADSHGNSDVWHFFTEPVERSNRLPSLPEGSLLARWQAADTTDAKRELGAQLQRLLTEGPPADPMHPDAVLYRQLHSFGGPLLSQVKLTPADRDSSPQAAEQDQWGGDPAAFGRHPDGSKIDAASLCVQAPSIVEIRLPTDLVAGTEFVATGVLHAETGQEGSVQLRASIDDPQPLADEAKRASKLRADLPVLVETDSDAKHVFAASFKEFRRWFPIALCYPKIVPTDEVITLTLYHREDEPLSRLMLSDDERNRLDRLWNELHFVSHDALTVVDAFTQLLEYASQDGDPTVFEPLRKPIEDRAAAFRSALLEAEPRHIKALVEFAARVYSRPLTSEEAQELRDLYQRLRSEELPHDEAFRLVLARLFVSPAFLYRLETAPPGTEPAPVSDQELANRLSYFLWSSLPDDELQNAAAAGKFHAPDDVAAQARRMLDDARIRRLATEFACQWLQIYEFDTLDEKSERHFPEFASVRDEMYEEPIRFFTDLFRRDGSILEILDADHAVLNETLAAHYGIPGVAGAEWRRVDDVRQYGRGGVLGFGATLAKHSGASRTSPTLRGAWISDVLLGEKLPPPPPDIPELPDEVSTDGLTVRELVERHSADPRCAGCHVRVDPFGFALEKFDSIGRFREQDSAGRPIDTRTTLRDGSKMEGIDGVRSHLLHDRRDAVVKQFCRKLLGYALGRSVRLSDQPLIEEMQERLKEQDYRFSVAVETIVRSRQFREIRGRDLKVADVP